MIRFKDPESFAIPEPRIRYIAHELARLLDFVELEQDGRPVKINGFRLRDLSKWVDYSTNTAMNALTPISSVCNSRCDFCFEENAPYAREASLMPIEEAHTRLKYYSPETGRCLFPSNRNHMETFIHPKALDIIEMARKKEPEKLFWITTNGSHFTEDVVRRLAASKPIIFKLSLNASDPTKNRNLMHTGKRTEIAINAPRLLQKYRIPFMGGIVAWPTMTLEEIRDTVKYLESFEAYAIRLRLPLAHKWLNHQLDVDFHEHWRHVGEFAHELRPMLSVPLFVEPPIYWVNPIVPEVDGVVLNSPAARVGLQAGDKIRAINKQPVRTRIESEALLDQHHMRGEKEIEIQADRNGELITFVLTEPVDGTDTYPYNSQQFYRGENYGIFHVEDFRLHHIQKILDIIVRYEAKTIVLFTSSIVAPIFETVAGCIPEFAEQLQKVTLYVETVANNAFGGNYSVMDSRVVEDYAANVRRLISTGIHPDLILIPDAFGSPWGIDVFGDSVERMSLEFGIPIERVDWLLVYGREV